MHKMLSKTSTLFLINLYTLYPGLLLRKNKQRVILLYSMSLRLAQNIITPSKLTQ